MLHLLSSGVNPRLPLGQCLRHWPHIARRLREPKRTRQRQLVRLPAYVPFC